MGKNFWRNATSEKLNIYKIFLKKTINIEIKLSVIENILKIAPSKNINQ